MKLQTDSVEKCGRKDEQAFSIPGEFQLTPRAPVIKSCE